METIARLVAFVAGIVIVVLTVWSVFTSLVLPSGDLLAHDAWPGPPPRRLGAQARPAPPELRGARPRPVVRRPRRGGGAVRALAGPDPARLLPDHLVEQRCQLPRRPGRRRLLGDHAWASRRPAGPARGPSRSWGPASASVSSRSRSRTSPRSTARSPPGRPRSHCSSARGGTPAWGPEILARHYWLDTMDELPPLYADWERWASAVSESHANYPGLDLVPLAGLVAQLAGRAGRHDGLGRALPLREPAVDARTRHGCACRWGSGACAPWPGRCTSPTTPTRCRRRASG